MVRADRQQGDLGPAISSYVLEPIEIGAVPRVVNSPPLMFQNEAAVATVTVPQYTSTPMFAGRQSDRPIPMRKAFPPFQFDDAAKTEIVREVAHAPRHQRNLWMRQAPKAGFMKMIEVRMSQQNEIDRRKVLDAQPGAFDAFQQKDPVREIWIDQYVQVVELNQK